jgi:hypothetical protein
MLVAAVVLLHVPGSHAVHAVEPVVLLNAPGPHDLQIDELFAASTAEADPAGQPRQTVDVVAPVVLDQDPATQATQLLAPGTVE